MLSSSRRLKHVCIWKDRGVWVDQGHRLCMCDSPTVPSQCPSSFPAELQTAVAITATQKHCSSCFLMQLSLRPDHRQAAGMLYLSPSSFQVFVPELLVVCQPQEQLAVPASFFSDEEPALLVCCSYRESGSGIKTKLIWHAKAQQPRTDKERNF